MTPGNILIDQRDLKKAAELRAVGRKVYLGPKGTPPEGIYYAGFGNQDIKRYPRWLYCGDKDPLLVKNTNEEQEARQRGYDEPWASCLSNKNLQNWFWDLEDMSPRQLVVYAQEEYGVDLPVEAGQERLLTAVMEIAKTAPQNRGRLALMAHTMRLNLDQTMEEIKKRVQDVSEVETKVIYL